MYVHFPTNVGHGRVRSEFTASLRKQVQKQQYICCEYHNKSCGARKKYVGIIPTNVVMKQKHLL